MYRRVSSIVSVVDGLPTYIKQGITVCTAVPISPEQSPSPETRVIRVAGSGWLPCFFCARSELTGVPASPRSGNLVEPILCQSTHVVAPFPSRTIVADFA